MHSNSLARAFMADGPGAALEPLVTDAPIVPETKALDDLLAPFAAFGASEPETRPTHHFARQNEPMIPHRIGVALGKLGLDIPLRYDVVCTNLPVEGRGQMVTPGSDHDLVWARLRGS